MPSSYHLGREHHLEDVRESLLNYPMPLALQPDVEFNEESNKITNNTPKTKEAYYFRKIFMAEYPGMCHTIPYYWMPKWSGEQNDPSARILSVYDKDKNM